MTRGASFSGAGELAHRVRLQRPSGSRDAVGARVTSWVDVATVYASIEPLSTGERFMATQERSNVTHTVTIRYSDQVAPIDSSWRVKYGARIFALNGAPINLDERNVLLQLPCIEGLRSE